MLEKVKVIIDSSSDLTFDEIEKYNVDVIPLTINIDGTEYDYRTISNDEYIERMRTASTYSTSQPAIGKFIEAFEKWTKEGYKVIVLTLSSALSGTYNTAVTASLEFEGIYVVDTKTTTRGMVFLLKECLSQLEQQIEIETIVENLREKAKNILTYVTIDKLDNLVKGGRLSKSQALIGGLLNIKVLTQLKETELVALDKVRGKKKLVHTLINHIEEAKQGKSIKNISLPNSLADEYVTLIKSELEEVFGYIVDEKEIFTTTPIISTHTGENAVGILVELE
ncbi:DegV family protein [uncultured Gemella sp.]|uniref:DegV family protein n=1 Tax=uncultured Gemella sp. TaxID=254352 RepID=UPI0028D76733|nr:DegV family protein [uncultured Gemella sp.]